MVKLVSVAFGLFAAATWRDLVEQMDERGLIEDHP
jgi:hypothetical protein